MKKINLRELYPDVYTTDFFVDVTEEVMETIRAAERAEAAYDRRMYRYKAYYSLDCDNGIENAILQSITMKLPSGVKLHNVTTGKTSKAGEAVEISGGTKFYLSAPLTQVQDVAGSWSATMKGSVTKDYSAYKISTGSGSQDLALVFGEGVDDEKYVDFKVTWVQYASVKVIKKDAKADAKLAGAVFGLYSDANCTNLITKLPATDANGEASVQIIKTQNTVYLKEITAPTGYRINATAYNVKLEVSKTATVTVPDEE